MSQFILENYMKYLLILLIVLSSCSNRPNNDIPSMSDEQKYFLEQQYERSFDLNSSVKKGYTILEQKGELKKLTIEEKDINKIEIELPASISTPLVYEADSLIYIYNAIMSNDDFNIAVYDKGGNLVTLFGRKGEGPQEFSQINALLKIDDVTLVFDNGYIKKIDQNWREFDRKFLNLWVRDVQKYRNDYVVRLSDNSTFPFPIALVDAETDSVITVIKDDRPGALNFSSSNGTTFYSTNESIFYAKTTLDYLHIIPVDHVKKTQHYRLSSPFIRQNSDIFKKEKSTPEEFYNYLNTLILLEKIFFYKDVVWLSFVDRKGNSQKYYLAKIDLSDLSKSRNTFSLMETTDSFKGFNFYKDHIYYVSRDKSNDRKLIFNTVNLEDLELKEF